VVGFVQELRRQELYKAPGVAETLDWVAALVALDRQQLDEAVADETLGALLKYREDVDQVRWTAAVAESPAGRPRLPARGPRHARRAALRGRFPAGKQPGEP
jgi:hypothetical protein